MEIATDLFFPNCDIHPSEMEYEKRGEKMKGGIALVNWMEEDLNASLQSKRGGV